MAYTTIKKPTDYFNTKLFTGNGSAGNAQTGIGFQPDLVWIKDRTNANHHRLADAVRGVGKGLISSLNWAEQVEATGLTSFNSDGFTVGANSDYNGNSASMASWNWKAGTTSGITTNGSSTITPTGYSFNATSGFSIIKYSGNSTAGAGVPHGLGAVPKMIIIKRLNNTDEWCVYHNAVGNEKYLRLNTTDAEVSTDDLWNDTTPDATNFILSGNGRVNQNGGQYIAYCFAEKQGYSKFGSYKGNGNADGTFCYLGFKPSFVIYKKAIQTGGQSGSWVIIDNKRDIDNVASHGLFPHASSVENTGSGYWDLDMLSNGFKLRTTEQETNGNAETFIYMAFAEAPLVGDNPATAR